MTINQIMDLVITISSVALVVIVAIYTKHKVEIDRKAMQGNELAKAEQLVAKTVEPLVYQAEKSGGDGDTKFTQVLNTVLGILDLAHLPHPSSQFIGGKLTTLVIMSNVQVGEIRKELQAVKAQNQSAAATQPTEPTQNTTPEVEGGNK